MGGKTLHVKNIADGGATISKVLKQVEDFAGSNTDIIVDRLLISVGTNDIRHCQDGVDHLRGPLKQMCSRIRELYPNTKIYFQNLLPLPCHDDNDWNTNQNVIYFNRILYNECVYRRFYYIQAFEEFILPWWNYWSPHIRNDSFFEGNGIHPSLNRGIAKLAKLYKYALHSKSFHPLIFQ